MQGSGLELSQSSLHSLNLVRGFPGDSVAKNLPANAGYAGDVGWIPGSGRSLDREDPLEEDTATDSSMPGESHGQKSLAGYSPGVTKNWTRLSDNTCALTY